ncbi:hypothetical protein QCA50_010995 [Cerrena zonata]|uniref:Uncharacterized protein n=1 Tax=Cerrena zonata TaxID=2478898 RepID=A0AAW0G7P1_9APHY
MLADGILGMDPSNVLGVILEIKAASEMNSGDPQIIGQILVLLEQTKRVAFTGAVTNGVYWRIFVVRIVEELHIYSTATSKAKNNTGLVVELLKDMMLFKL